MDPFLVDHRVAWLLSGLHKQAYVATSRARARSPNVLSEDAVAVYRTMVRAYVEWALTQGLDPKQDPTAAINAFLEHKCAGPSGWSEGTYRRYARLLTRLHWAVQGGSLVVIKGWPSTAEAAPSALSKTAAESDEIEAAWSLGMDAWITREEVLRLTDPVFSLAGPASAAPGVPVLPRDVPWKLARNLVILSLGLDLGLRFQEIRRLRQGSFSTEADETRVTIHRDETAPTARHRLVTASGDSEIDTSPGMVRAHRLLQWWLKLMPETLRGSDRPILPSTGKGGHLTPSTVFRILEGLGAHSPDPDHWLFHGGIQALRRAHIHMALAEGVPPQELQNRLGIHHRASIERYLG